MSEYAQHLLPSGATGLEKTLSTVDAERLALFPPQVLLGLLDPQTVPKAFLPALALQRSVEEEWDLAVTEQQQRDLLANAYALNARKGTPFAIKRGLAVLGYPGVTLKEGYAPIRHDGTIRRNRRWQYNSNGFWALFDVNLPLSAAQGLDAAERARVLRGVEIWQRAACYIRLLNVQSTSLAERPVPAKALPLIHVGVTLLALRDTPRDGRFRRTGATRYRYDGRFRHDGTVPRDRRIIADDGLKFGPPNTQPQIGVHTTIVAERRPSLTYDGTVPRNGTLRRNYRGARGLTRSLFSEFSAEFGTEFGPILPGASS